MKQRNKFKLFFYWATIDVFCCHSVASLLLLRTVIVTPTATYESQFVEVAEQHSRNQL